jgi:hypothetical protein
MTLDRADRCHGVDDPVAEDAIARDVDGPGVYLTDEVFLYRVVGVVPIRVDEMVELEDCFRLDVVRVPATDLRARQLRAVTPAPVQI